MSQRDVYKQIMRNELPTAFPKGAVESIIGLSEINYNNINLNEARIQNLENNETIFQVFSYVGTSPSGQVNLYQGGEIFDIYGDGLVDAIVVKAENQKPIEEFVVDSSGQNVTVTSLTDNGDYTANYVLSGTPIQEACVVYFIRIKGIDKHNVDSDYIIPPSIISVHPESLYSGPVTNAFLVDNGNGTGTIPSFEANIFSNADATGLVKRYVIAEQTFTFTDGEEEYIAVNFNNGNPIVQKLTTTPNFTVDARVYTVIVVWRQGNILHSIDTPEYGIALPNKLYSMILNTEPYKRSLNGGLILSETQTPANRTVLISSAIVYAGIYPIPVLAFNSSQHSMVLVTQANGVWSYTGSQTQYNNTQYNPLTGPVVSGTGKYLNRYFFRSIGDTIETFYVLGLEEHNSLAAAQLESVPNIPILLRDHCVFVGRIIVIYGAVTASAVETPFDTVFRSSDVINHNDTANIQGGDTDTYYHSDQPINTTDNVAFQKVTAQGDSDDGSSNAAEFKNQTGDIVQFIDTNGFRGIRYRDEYVGGSWVSAAGAAAPDLVAYTIGGVATTKYSFNGAVTEERISNTFEMAHDVAFEEVNAGNLYIEAHIHWRPSTNNAGQVEWFFDYSYDKVNSAPIAQTSLVSLGVVNSNEQYYHKITSFEDAVAVVRIPIPSGGFSLGDIINFTLRRTPNGVNDTYPDDAILEKVALHVPTNDDGSRQRYVK